MDPWMDRYGSLQNYNGYAFSRSSPINFTDPMGMASVAEIAATGGILSVVMGIVGYNLFEAAGFSGIRGMLTGFVGATGLTVAFATGKLLPVVTDALIAAVLNIGISMSIDIYKGEDLKSKTWEYAATGFDAFSSSI